MFILDVDEFDRLVRDYGHAGAERALTAVNELVRGRVRDTDIVSRAGSEQFAVCGWVDNLDDTLALAHRLRAEVAALSLPVRDGQRLVPTISVGVAVRQPGEPVETLIARADQALHRARHAGGNQVAVSDSQ